MTKTWRSLPPTEKQLSALCNMERALGYKFGECVPPETRGEASDLIRTRRLNIINNISAAGMINVTKFDPDADWDCGDCF